MPGGQLPGAKGATPKSAPGPGPGPGFPGPPPKSGAPGGGVPGRLMTGEEEARMRKQWFEKLDEIEKDAKRNPLNASTSASERPICVAYQEGRCEFGAWCFWSHGDREHAFGEGAAKKEFEPVWAPAPAKDQAGRFVGSSYTSPHI